MILVSRRMIFCIVLIVQILALAYMLLTAKQGYSSFVTICKENSQLEEKCKKKIEEIREIQIQVHEWKTSSFLQEKYAREKLHMGKKEEQIFFYE